MANDNQDEPQVLETEVEVREVPVEDETPEEEPVELEVIEDDDQTDEEREELQRKIAELEKKNRQLFERAKKQEVKREEPALSAKDLLALQGASVSEDDLDEVIDFARYKKVSISEALKTQTLKTILAERAEERRTAQATETKSPRGIAKQTGEDLLRKAEATGEVPLTQKGLEDLVMARLMRKKNRGGN